MFPESDHGQGDCVYRTVPDRVPVLGVSAAADGGDAAAEEEEEDDDDDDKDDYEDDDDEVCFQGVVTGKVAMSIELFPTDYRSLASLVMAIVWTTGSCSMALTAYLLQDYSWRCLQCSLSAVSLIAFFQMW